MIKETSGCKDPEVFVKLVHNRDGEYENLK